jgi:hypothetical protein
MMNALPDHMAISGGVIFLIAGEQIFSLDIELRYTNCHRLLVDRILSVKACLVVVAQ